MLDEIDKRDTDRGRQRQLKGPRAANEVSIDHVSSLFNTCNPIDVSNSNDVY